MEQIGYIHQSESRSYHHSRLKPLPGYISLTMERCCISFDDEPSERRAKMPCGCPIGVDAMKNMCMAALSDGEYTFSCPQCRAPWEFFLIRHVLSAKLSPEQLSDISGQLDENFIRRPQHDIRQCLRCQTFSQRDLSLVPFNQNIDRVICNICSQEEERLVEFCWQCGQEWKTDSNDSCGNPNCASLEASCVKTLATCGTKKIYGIVGVPDTRACPQCGILISHVENCKHMRCSMCRCEFCFVCLRTQVNGRWQCGTYLETCAVAPRQTSLPKH